MADLKQIKVGTTTYNIEPYTAYLKLDGSTKMTGNLQMTENSTSILLRSGSDTWYSGIYANSTGDEVLGIVAVNPRTHIMLGTANPLDRPACTALTPAIDIKNGKVGINKRLGTDGSADAGSYNLDVNGTIGAQSIVLDTEGSLTTHKIIHDGEESDLEIGDPNNNAYVKFVEDVQIGDLIINAEDGHMGGIEKIAIGAGSSASDCDVVVGAEASATGTSVAVGYDSHCNSTGSVAVGYSADAYGTTATAMGYSSSASGAYSVALGSNSTATNTHSTAVGYLARATAYGSVAVGSSPTSSGYYSVALGYSSHSNSTGAVAIGYGAKALFNHTIAIGNSPTASGVYGIALGYQAKATATAGVAIGYSTDATATGSIAIGYNPTSSGYYSIAAGYNSYASSTGAIAIGYSADATNKGAIAIGYNPTASGIYSIGLGYEAKSADRSIMIGANVCSSSATIEENAIGIGTGADPQTDSTATVTPRALYAGTGAVAIGSAHSTISSGWASYRNAAYARFFGIAIGSGATATGSNSVALGTNTDSYGTVVGSSSKAYGSNCIAIGKVAYAGSSSYLNASSPSQGAYSIAIGYGVSASVSSSRSLIKIGQTSHNTYFYAGTSASWSSGSDIRDKTNIQPIYGGIDLIKNIQPISFQYNYRNTYSDTGSFLDYDIEEHKKATKADDELKFGFAAQEVANYFDRVYGDEKINNIVGHDYEVDADTGETADYYSIAEGGFIPFLFQAIKEQQDVIESLEERIIKLEKILTKEG